MPSAPHGETFEFTGDASALRESEYPAWVRFESIQMTLEITDAQDGAGDSLVVTIETRPNDQYAWSVLDTFTTILGNASEPVQETRFLIKNPGGAWSNHIAIRSTLAGGTADFTGRVVLEAK